jgi:hypothetical protein
MPPASFRCAMLRMSAANDDVSREDRSRALRVARNHLSMVSCAV